MVLVLSHTWLSQPVAGMGDYRLGYFSNRIKTISGVQCLNGK